MIKDRSQQSIAAYMEAAKARRGQQTAQVKAAPLTRWGLPPDEAEALMGAIAAPEPVPAKPKGRNLVQKIAAPVSYWTRKVVPGLAERFVGGTTMRTLLGWRFGQEAVDEYDASWQAASLKFKEAKAERGLLGAMGTWFTAAAEVREERPKLFWAEKPIGEFAADPTTYMGWGLVSKIPVLGRLGLGFLFDVVPNKVAQQTIGRVSALMRKGVTEVLTGAPRLLGWQLARSEQTVAKGLALEARDYMTVRFGGAEGMAKASRMDTAKFLDEFTARAPSGAVAEGADATMAAVMANAEQVARIVATQTPPKAEDLIREAIAGVGKRDKTGTFIQDWYAQTPEQLTHTIGSLVEKDQTKRLYQEYRTYIQGRSTIARGISHLYTADQASWFQTKLLRYGVFEPSRAMLVFANYGIFNTVEDLARIALTGHAPVRSGVNLVDMATIGQVVPETMRGGTAEATRMSISMGLPDELPTLLNWQPVKSLALPVFRFNKAVQQIGTAFRRGLLVEDYKKQLIAGWQKAGLWNSELADSIAEMMRVIPKGADQDTVKAAYILALRGEPGAIRAMAGHIQRGDIDSAGMVKALAMADQIPSEVKQVMVRDFEERGGDIFIPANKEANLNKMWDMEVSRLQKHPKAIAEKLDGFMETMRKEAISPDLSPEDAMGLLQKSVELASAYINQPFIQGGITIPGILASESTTRGPMWGQLDETYRLLSAGISRQYDELAKVLGAIKSRMGAHPEVQKQLDLAAKFFAEGKHQNQSYWSQVLDLKARFFPQNLSGREWGAVAKELSQATTSAEVRGIINSANIPPEWADVLLRSGPVEYGPGHFQAAGVDLESAIEGLTTKKERADLEGVIRLSLEPALREAMWKASRGAPRVTAENFEALGKALAKFQKGPESTYGLLQDMIPTVAEVSQSEMGRQHYDALVSMYDTLAEEFTRQQTSRPVEALHGWMESLASAMDGAGPETLVKLKTAAQEALDRAIVTVKNTFTNYDDTLIVDEALKRFFPFWLYQSRSWPWLLAASVSHPGLVTTLAPGGRYWDLTEDGYVPSPLLGMQVAPLRGTVFGRLRRAWRAEFPATLPGIAGEVEALVGKAERYGFFPGFGVSVPIEVGLSLAHGGSSKEVAAVLVESMPPILASVTDAMIAASRPLGASRTLALAERILPSKFREYYAAKLLWDAHQVSLAEAKRAGHDDWIADAYVATAYRQIVEEQVSLSRVNPESWKAIASNIDKAVAEEAGLTVEQVQEYRKQARVQGLRMSEVLPLNRLQRAAIELVVGMDALSDATKTLSPDDRRRYLTAKNDYYNTREQHRAQQTEDQAEDDARFEADQITAKDWRDGLSDRTREYRALDNMLQSDYFGQLGRTAAERQAVSEKFQTASEPQPVDSILDGLFAMQAPVDENGDEDYGALFLAQDELLKMIPEEVRADILEYLRRSQTPLVREFREGQAVALRYFRVSEGVAEMYTTLGNKERAEYLTALYKRQTELNLASQSFLRQEKAVPRSMLVQASQIRRVLDREKRLYRRWLVTPGTAHYSPDLARYIAKFYAQDLTL